MRKCPVGASSSCSEPAWAVSVPAAASARQASRALRAKQKIPAPLGASERNILDRIIAKTLSMDHGVLSLGANIGGLQHRLPFFGFRMQEGLELLRPAADRRRP